MSTTSAVETLHSCTLQIYNMCRYRRYRIDIISPLWKSMIITSIFSDIISISICLHQIGKYKWSMSISSYCVRYCRYQYHKCNANFFRVCHWCPCCHFVYDIFDLEINVMQRSGSISIFSNYCVRYRHRRFYLYPALFYTSLGGKSDLPLSVQQWKIQYSICVIIWDWNTRQDILLKTSLHTVLLI